MIRWELSPFHRFAPVDLFAAFLAALVLSVRSRAALQLEVVALRHQLGVLQRSVKRPTLTSSDRLFWAWLCSVWPDLAISTGHRQTGHRHRVASHGLPVVLEVEDSLWTTRTAA